VSGLQRTLLTAVVAAVCVAVPAGARAQAGYARFDVASVSDSTFTFTTVGASWVARGQVGLAVDPSHADELIARFRVASVARDTATAIVTGQTARLTTSHVALLAQPKPPFYRQRWFWIGALAGGVIGFVAHSH
jgi:hypothetical protein